MALQRAGIEAQVFEAHAFEEDSPAAEAGSYLTVATNGLDALRAIDAHGPVLAAGFPTPWTIMLSGTGKRLGRVALGSNLPGRDVSHTIKRPHLHRALHDEASRRGISIAFGKRLVATETAGTGIRAVFGDGSDAVGDLLIGSDGVHSAVRTIIDPSGAEAAIRGAAQFRRLYRRRRSTANRAPGT